MGMVTVRVVALAAVTIAGALLNKTLLSNAAVEKFVPVIVTAVPTAPCVGEKLVMVGTDVAAVILIL